MPHEMLKGLLKMANIILKYLVYLRRVIKMFANKCSEIPECTFLQDSCNIAVVLLKIWQCKCVYSVHRNLCYIPLVSRSIHCFVIGVVLGVFFQFRNQGKEPCHSRGQCLQSFLPKQIVRYCLLLTGRNGDCNCRGN